MSEFKSYSKFIYDKFYKSKNVATLFVTSSQNGVSPKQLILSFFISLSFSLLLVIELGANPFDLIISVLPIIISSVITVIGFLLISYTIVIVHINKQNAFKDFTLPSGSKGEPPLRLILLHFIFPSILFLSLFLTSSLIQLIVNLKITFRLNFISVGAFNLIVSNYLLTHFLYSVFEIGNYFYNIYVYISSTAKKESEAYEMDLFIKRRESELLTPEEKSHLTILDKYYEK